MSQSLALITILVICIWGCLCGLGAIAVTPLTFGCVFGLVFSTLFLHIGSTSATMRYMFQQLGKDIRESEEKEEK